MNHFDNENAILEFFQKEKTSSIYFVNETNKVHSILESIYDNQKWMQWINSSKKTDPPPDFYNDTYEIMMDVMRVDDHSFINKKNKIVNLTNKKESLIQADINNSGILGCSNTRNVFVNSVTDLKTEEDHNYKYYKSNFIRTLKHHRNKIDQYKKNHPGYKVIFFIFDESSAYFQVECNSEREGKFFNEYIRQGKPHLFFWDEDFALELMKKEVDYVIWYAPFKLLNTNKGRIDLPKACVYDINGSGINLIKYEEIKMISSEL